METLRSESRVMRTVAMVRMGIFMRMQIVIPMMQGMGTLSVMSLRRRLGWRHRTRRERKPRRLLGRKRRSKNKNRNISKSLRHHIKKYLAANKNS